MSVTRLSTRLLLSPSDLPASRDDFEVVSAFNPGAIRLPDGEVILLVRVAESPRERRAGYTALPSWHPEKKLTHEWMSDLDLIHLDPRVIKRNSDGLVRLTFSSHLRVIHCGDGRSVKTISDVILTPENELEEFGVEDPRITLIDSRYYITYVAVSRHGPATALASTTDFKTFERHGLIACPENKDVVLFPEKINNTFCALHRPVCGTPFTRPEMWVASSPDLIHWGNHRPLDVGGGSWQSGRVGAGAPPIRVPQGWLEIYHGNAHPTQPGAVGKYYGGLLLLDEHDPTKVIARSTEPFLWPEADFEVNGFVPNVVFPTGVVADGDTLLIFYGAADACTAVVEYSRQALLDSLTPTG